MSSSGVGKKMQCCVWDQYKYALYKKFREPKLYQYAARGDWDLIPDRCKSHPKEATYVNVYPPKDTALHKIVRTSSCKQCEESTRSEIYDMRERAVMALVAANPGAVATQDTFQRTPLHWACMDVESNSYVSSIDMDGGDMITVIKIMAKSDASALAITDVEKRTPLHYLVARNRSIPLELLSTIVALYPEALDITDEVGESPVDIIDARRDEIENYEGVVKQIANLRTMFPSSSHMVHGA